MDAHRPTPLQHQPTELSSAAFRSADPIIQPRLRRLLWLYNLALPFVLPFFLPAALRKNFRRGGTWRDFRERFTRYRQSVYLFLAQDHPRLWVHAVSVGEMMVAKKIVTALLAHDERLDIVLTTTTSTGLALARQSFDDPRVVVMHNPLDLPWVVERALDLVCPQALILVESELWPNLVSRTRSRGIPVILANARLSTRSERRYQKLRSWVAPLFGLLNRVGVPEKEDISRWQNLGVSAEALHFTGNIKYDEKGAKTVSVTDKFSSLLEKLWGEKNLPVLFLASTHPGEEKALAEVYLQLRERLEKLRLIIVPRHVERTAEVLADLATLGLRGVRRSQLDEIGEEKNAALIIDTTGEMKSWLPCATVVVMGKSFLAHGGQNPVEPLRCGRPVICGPYMENFTHLVEQLVQHGAALQVADLGQLKKVLFELLNDSPRREHLVAQAADALAKHDGATERTIVQVIKPELVFLKKTISGGDD